MDITLSIKVDEKLWGAEEYLAILRKAGWSKKEIKTDLINFFYEDIMCLLKEAKWKFNFKGEER